MPTAGVIILLGVVYGIGVQGLDCLKPAPTEADVAAFSAKLSSPAVLNAQVSYNGAASLIQDGLSNGTEPVYILPTPRFVVTPLTAEDVVAAVQFAADFCLKVAALGTGHQIAGLALAEAGVTIQMRNLNATSFDNTTFVATAQMGATSGMVDAAILPFNRLPIAGTCHHVGVAGFTLHGGNGWASMWHGAAADFVQSMDVVTIGSDGNATRRNVTVQSEPDLFFGLRGAGGNLGVVIEYTTMTFPTPSLVQTSYYSVEIDLATEVLTWWSGFFAKSPRSIAPFVEFNTAASDPVHGANILIASYNVGPATAETDAYFKELDAYLRPRSYSAPENGTISEEVPYLEFANLEEFCGDLTLPTYWNTYYTPNGTLRTGTLPVDLINTMVEQIQLSNSSTATFSIEATPTLPLGDVAAFFTPNAWSFRDSYQLFVGDTWQRTGSGSPAEQDLEKVQWVKDASQALKPFTVGNYINQLMLEETDDATRSYAAGILSRLRSVKAAADPLNLFRSLDYVHTN